MIFHTVIFCIQTKSVSLMTDCEKFDAATQTHSESVQREIEALGVELDSGLITQESHDEQVISLALLCLQEEANIISTIILDNKPSIAEPSIAEPSIAEPSTILFSTKEAQ